MTSSNPFDVINENNPSQNYEEFTGSNPFDVIQQREAEQNTEKLKTILNNVHRLDPDKTGEAQRLAEKLGLPSGYDLTSPETLKYLQNRNRQRSIAELNMAAANPILLRQLTDPNFTAIAQDNMENLGLIEGTFSGIRNFPESIQQGWEKGRLEAESGQLGFQKGLNVELGKSNEAIDKRLIEIGLRLEELEGDGSGMWENTAAIGGQWSKTLQTAIGYGVAGGTVGATLGTLGGVFAPITVTGGLITGFTWGLATGSAKAAFQIEAGHQYNTLIDMGYSHNMARNVGIAVGLVNGGLEFTGVGFVLSPLKNLLIRELTGEVTKALTRPTLRAVLTKTSQVAVRNWTAEVGTEAVQELTNMAGEEFAGYFEDEEFEFLIQTKEGRKVIIDRLVQVLEKVGTGMLPLAGISAGPVYVSNIAKVQRANKETAFLESLNNLSTKDVTRKRNVNAFENYVQNVANGNDVSNIYVDAEVFNQQMKENGITMNQLELFNPQIANDLKEINSTGGNGDVAIPTGTYAAKIAGTDFGNALQPHMRVTQDSMSATEAGQFAGERNKLKQEAEKILQEQEQFNKELKKDAETIRENIDNQLKENSKYTKKQRMFLSTFVRDFAITQANQLGIKPSEFFSKYFYNITTDEKYNAAANQQLFNQDGSVKLESAAFKNWFGTSMLKDKNGKPLLLFHGTADNISEFNFKHPNRKDTGWLGTGVYMTDNASLAKYYADIKAMKKKQGRLPDDGVRSTILPLYARLENPYMATIEEKERVRFGGQGAADAFRDKLINEGYDGVIMPVLDGREIVVFDNKAVKSQFNSGTWSREVADLLKQLKQEDTFNQRQQKQQQGKPVPDSVFDIARIVENFEFAASKPFGVIRDFKLEIQDRVKKAAKKAGVDLTDKSLETEKYLVRTVLDDAIYALIENSNAVGWYNEKVTKAKRILSLIHPEIATDRKANFAFTWALANTSNQIEVNKNFVLAEIAYRQWKETGKFPTDIGIGMSTRAINHNFELYNRLIEEKEFDDLEQFMNTTHTVAEVEEYTNDTVSGENKSEIVYGAAVMGAKIGNGFFANLYGNYEQLTMDRWLMRSWGRMTGTLVKDQRKQANMKREQLKPLIKRLTPKQKKQLQDLIGIKIRMTNLDEVAVKIKTASTNTTKRDQIAAIGLIKDNPDHEQFLIDILGKPQKNRPRLGIGDEIRKNGNSYAGYLDGQKEDPSGAPERRFIRKVFNQVLPVLQQEQPDLTMADLQALLWYPEKRLYDSAKLDEDENVTGYVDDGAPDYANASVNLARQLGVSETDIQNTIQEVDNELELQTTDNAREVGSRERGSDDIQGDNATFSQRKAETEFGTDEGTGLPLNSDGTVTIFHHTDRQSADRIRESNQLRSTTTTDPFFTTRDTADTGYGDTVIGLRIDPDRLSVDDEFPDGRRDYRLSDSRFTETTIPVEVDENPNVPDFAPTQDQINRNVIDRVVELGEPYMGEYGDKSPNEVDKQLRDKARDLFSTPTATPEEAAAARERIIEKTKLRRTRDNLEKRSKEIFEQKSSDTRGQFDPKTLTTILTQEADFSTFLHETAHYMLSVMEDIAVSDQASQQQKDDFDTLLKFFNVDSVETWNGLSINEKRKYHEAFAYNYEIYLFEGKAPNTKLQEIFSQFSRFLKRIYKSIVNDLNAIYRAENGTDLPILTDEIRSVMDRMIASEDQIQQAEEIYGMKPMFQTQEQSKMDDATWKKYTEAHQKAQDEAMDKLTQSSMRQVKWLSNARDKYIKNLQRDVEKTRKKVIEEETNKVENEKLYRTIAFLKKGQFTNDQGERVVAGSGYKLEIADVKRLFPDDKDITKKLGTGAYGLVAKEGMPVAVVADMFGFKDAKLLITSLLEARKIKDVIMERVDERMLNEFSDLTDPRQQELLMQEALHNEARARFISVELRFISKSMQPVRYQVAAARQVARELLAEKKLRDIKPSQFSRNEIKAAQKVEEAMKEGNTVAAIKAKKSQLLNNQLAKEAIAVHETYDNATKLFKKIFQKDKKIASLKRNTNLVNAAKSILASYGLGPAVENPAQYTDKLKAYNPDMYEQLEPIIEELTATGNQDIKELTFEKFQTIYETIETLWYQSRRDQQVVIDNKKVDTEAVVEELLEVMSRMDTPDPVGARQAPGKKARRFRLLQQGKSMIRRIEHWCDGMDGATKSGEGVIGGVVLKRDQVQAGAFTRYIWRPVKDALNKYRVERNNYTKEYSKMLDKLDMGKDKIVAEELGYTFGNESGGLGKVELLGAMLHIGNKSNLRKLLLGRKWGRLDQDGSLNTSRWDNFVARMIDEGILTKQDFQFLQDVWDLNERMKPLLQKAHSDIYGYYFKEIEATPIVNRFGSFRGGYVPAKTDPFMVSEAKIQQKLDELRGEFRKSMPTTGNGFTKERVEYNKALSLDLRLMTKHIDDAIRFAYVQPAIEDVYKIFKNKDFKDRIDALDPTAMEDMLLPWLNRSARQITLEAGRWPAFDMFWTTVRARTGIGIMFANIRNALQQLTGYFPAMLKVEPKYLKGALATYMQNPMKQQQEIAELSPYMAERQYNQIFDVQDTLNELLINPSRYDKIQAWSKKHGYFIQQAFQNQVDTVVWAGTYNKVLAEGSLEMSDVDIQKEAIQQADANVRLTQDSLQAEDLAAFQVGTPFYKTMVQFGGYFNMLANLNATQYKKLFKDLGWRGNKGKLFMTYLLGFAMPAFVADLIVRATGGDLEDEDEDGYLDDVAGWFFNSQFRTGAALIPFGNLAIVPFNSLNDLPYDDRMTTSPSISYLESSTIGTVKTLINILDPDKDVTGKNVRDVLTLLSLVTGIPLTVLGRPIGVQIDVERGVVDPENTPDHIRALLTGKPSQRSRR